VSTTISCRFFAPAAALLFALTVTIPLFAQAPQQPMTAAQRQRLRAKMRPPQPVPDAERWSAVVGAETFVAPVMTDRHVYALRPPGTIVALALEDGKEIWTVDLPVDQPFVVDDGRIFVTGAGSMNAINASTGAVVWRHPIGALTAPALIHQGWVITIAAGEITARRAADGTVVWKQPHGAQRLRPTIEGDTLYLPLADGTVAALNLTTGVKKWEYQLRGPSEIAALGKRVYVGSEDKYFYCLDADNGRMAWRKHVGAAVIGRPAIDAHRVYLASIDNQIRALDRVDGAVEWQDGLSFRPSAGPILFGTAVVVPGAVMALETFDTATGKAGRAITFPAPLASPLSIYPSAKGPLAATITGALDVEWKLSVWEPSMAIPIAPLTVLPGKAAPLLPALSTVVGGS
jgi:outer membrane protein assembly factor BamB